MASRRGSTTRRVGPRRSVSIDPTHARALVDRFFDALGHFAGERPALEELARVLAPSARIMDLGGEDNAPAGEATTVRSNFPRDAWLVKLSESSERRRSAGQGHFFEVLERTVTADESELCVGSVVEERVTRDDRIEHAQVLECSLVVSEIEGRTSIVEVRARRCSRRRLR